MGKNSREISFEILKAIEEDGKYSNLELKARLKNIAFQDENFIRELVYGILENRILIDYNIDKFLKKPLSRHKLREQIILRIGFYQLGFMRGVKPHGAINETVKLAKKFIKGRHGFINGVLRNFQRNNSQIIYPAKPEIKEGKDSWTKYFSTKYSYSQWICQLWINQYGIEKTEEIMSSTMGRPPLTIRTNRIKINKDQLIVKLKERGFETELVASSDTAIMVKGQGLLETEMYEKGEFSVQDYASQNAISSIDLEGVANVVDVCAAPGGKTLALAEKLEDKGKIYALDIYSHKLKLIEGQMKRLGLRNIKIEKWDSTKTMKKLENYADLVIADLPCSGLGVIRRRPEIKLNKTLEDVFQIVEMQKKILEASCKYIKEGGMMFFSTCTLNYLENEKLLEDFLTKHKNFKLIYKNELLPIDGSSDGFFYSLCKKEHYDKDRI